MRNLIILDEFPSSLVNGVGTFVRNLITMLPRDLFNVSLVNLNVTVPEFCISENPDLKTFSIPSVKGGNFYEAGINIAAVLSLHIPDSVDNVFVINHSPCLSLLKALKRFFRKSKFVFIIHNQGWNSPLLGNEEFLKSLIVDRKRPKQVNKELASFIRNYVREERRFYPMFDAVVALSESTMDILRNIYKVRMDNIHLIPNGVRYVPESEITESSEAKRSLGLSTDERTLLFAGRIAESKGIGHLLKAFASLIEEQHDLRLLIAGPGNEITKYLSAVDISVRSRITILTHVPPEKMATIYDAADICVMPSFTEQCSYVALEMMARRKLIVTSESVGQRDIFRNNVNALTFRHWNKDCSTVKSIESAIRKCLQLSEERRKGFRDYNISLINQEFSIESHRERLIDLFKNF